jgi:hypothetical protein
MADTFDFLGGIILGTFIGSLATLIYHLREIRHETRQNYVRLSLAQSEVVTLERTLEIHRRNSVTDFAQQHPSESESEAPSTPPRIPIWMGNLDASIVSQTSSNLPFANPRKSGSGVRKSQGLEDCEFQ